MVNQNGRRWLAAIGSRAALVGVLMLVLGSPPTAAINGQAPTTAQRLTRTRRTVQVPYRLTNTQHLLVRARLNGHDPLNFIVDTGAPALFMASESAKKVGLNEGKIGWAVVNRLEIEGGPVLDRVSGRIEDLFQLRGMNSMGIAGGRIDGVLGYNVLAHFRMEIDLTRSTMAWTELDFVPPPPPSVRDLLPEGEEIEEPETLGAMESFANLASALLKRKPPPPPVGRGFFGLQLGPTATHKVGTRARTPGAAILGVVAAGPAARAGLRAGDRVVGVKLSGGKLETVRSAGALIQMTRAVRADQPVVMSVIRGRARLNVTVRPVKEGL